MVYDLNPVNSPLPLLQIIGYPDYCVFRVVTAQRIQPHIVQRPHIMHCLTCCCNPCRIIERYTGHAGRAIQVGSAPIISNGNAYLRRANNKFLILIISERLNCTIFRQVEQRRQGREDRGAFCQLVVVDVNSSFAADEVTRQQLGSNLFDIRCNRAIRTPAHLRSVVTGCCCCSGSDAIRRDGYRLFAVRDVPSSLPDLFQVLLVARRQRHRSIFFRRRNVVVIFAA